MADIATTLTLIGSGLNTLKELNNVSREYDKATLKLKVAELAQAISAAQIALSEAQQEITTKDAEIRRLKESFRRRGKLVEYAGYKYDRASTGKPQGVPYCYRCEHDGVLMRLAEKAMGRGLLQCPQCKAEFDQAPMFAYEEK